MDEQACAKSPGVDPTQQPGVKLNKDGRPRKKMGPPEKAIDWDDVDKLLLFQATQEEVAAWYNCTIDTLDNHCKRKFQKTYLEYSRERRQIGKLSIRRKMFQSAMSGNVTMMIWWSKNHMGMTDKVGVGGLADGVPFTLRHVAVFEGDDEQVDASGHREEGAEPSGT